MAPVTQLNLLSIGVVLLVACAFLLRKPHDQRMAGLFFAALLMFVLLFVDDLALAIATRATSIRYDQYVFCFDRLFGSPSFVIGRLFVLYPWFQILASYAYILIPSVCLGLATLYFFLLPIRDGIRCVGTIVMSGLLAYPIFLLLPVSGPRYAFSSFPFSEPAHLVPHLISLQAFPNGVPSVHMTLALLILWFARPWKSATVFAAFFLVLTVAATLGTGEHYLFDLFAAVPYTMLMIYLGGRSSSRGSAFGVGARIQEPLVGTEETGLNL